MQEVDVLLAQGKDVYEVNPLHGTALSVAALKNNIPMVKHLLNKGADVNIGSSLKVLERHPDLLNEVITA